MESAIPLDPQSVQGTMLLPLWGRAFFSARHPYLLDDHDAQDIIRRQRFDFSAIERSFGEFSGICYLVRARRIDDTIRRFIADHPEATIVNIGCGLDTGFSRVDNGSIRWYDLDLPDSIEFRRTLIPDGERNVCIAKSLLDESWLDDISFDRERGVMFVAGGVLYYFEEERLRSIVTAMAKRFPGGMLFFDAESKSAVKKSNDMVRRTGNHGAHMHFFVNDASGLRAWSPAISAVSAEPFFDGLPSKEGFAMRAQTTMADLLGMMKFVRLGFAD